MLGNCSCFFLSTDFVKNHVFTNKSHRATIRVSNSVDPDEALYSVGLHLGSNCLQRLSTGDKGFLAVSRAISLNETFVLFC